MFYIHRRKQTEAMEAESIRAKLGIAYCRRTRTDDAAFDVWQLQICYQDSRVFVSSGYNKSVLWPSRQA